ncbi:TPA: hypothetical protein DIS60_00505 [Patescibacteria group bacterium]|nr:hypothetical protein [Patescibacteria group bacterium]
MAENTKPPKTAVIDASFILSYCLPDEKNDSVNLIIDSFTKGTTNFISSPLLLFEVCNALYMAVRRKRLSRDYAETMVQNILLFDIVFIPMQFSEVFSLAAEQGITVYDASYVWIAQNKHVPLLTLDRSLARIALSI